MGNFFASGLTASSKTSRILLLGLDEAGKTCLLRQLSGYVGSNEGNHERKYGDVVPLAPTHGFQIHTLQYKGFRMEVVDIGGTKANRPHWRKYYDNVHGIIFVIDAADRRRFEEAGVALEEVLEDERLANVPLLIFANKQDLLNALEPSKARRNFHLKSGLFVFCLALITHSFFLLLFRCFADDGGDGPPHGGHEPPVAHPGVLRKNR